jgi:hypothetical protein
VDDFQGGVCKVSAIVEKRDGIYVRLEELGDWEVSWKYLLEGQDEWRGRYGKQPGRPDPDFRREFNEQQPNASLPRRPGTERTREERSM